MTSMIVEELGRIPMSPFLRATLTRAADYSAAQGHREVTLEHVLLALSEDPEASVILRSSDIDLARLTSDVSSYVGRIDDRADPGAPPATILSQDLKRVLEAAAAAAQQGKRREINGAIVLAAIVGDGRSPAAHMLRSQGLTFEAAIRALQKSTAPAARGPAPRPATTEDILASARERIHTRTHPPVVQQTETSFEPQPEPLALPSPETMRQPPQQEGPSEAPNGAMAGQPAPPAAANAPSASRAAPPVPGKSVDGRPPAPRPASAPDGLDAALAEVRRESAGSTGGRQSGSLEPIWQPAQLPPGAPPARPGGPMNEPPPGGMAPGDRHADVEAPPPFQPAPQWTPPPPSAPPHAGQSAPRPLRAPPPLPSTAAPARPGGSPPQPPGHAMPQAGPPTGQRPPQMPPPSAPWPDPAAAAGGAYDDSLARLDARRPPSAAPSGSQAARRAGSGAPVSVQTGQLVHNIPSFMRVDIPLIVEARIARADVKAITSGMIGPGAPVRHEINVTKAMAVRLKAPDGGFFVETASPETQWIENVNGLMADDFASWRWSITPRERGKRRLQLVVSARTVGPDGLAAETALPDQVIEVKVGINYAASARRVAIWTAAAMAGGLLGRFGDKLFDIARVLVSGSGSG